MWLRGALGLFIIILIIPTHQDESVGMINQDESSVSAGEVATAAQGIVNDISGICERNPTACNTGSTVAGILKKKAQYGAEFIMSMLSKKPQNDDTLNPVDREESWSTLEYNESREREMNTR